MVAYLTSDREVVSDLWQPWICATGGVEILKQEVGVS